MKTTSEKLKVYFEEKERFIEYKRKHEKIMSFLERGYPSIEELTKIHDLIIELKKERKSNV